MPDGNFEIGKYKGKKDGKEDFASPGDEDF
jgi:hypothetical protein